MSKNGRRNGVSFHRKDDRSALPGPRGSNTLWHQTVGGEGEQRKADRLRFSVQHYLA